MKIMLLGDMPPCKNYTAGIVLNLMCDFLLESGHDVCCFAVKLQSLPYEPEIPIDKLERMKFAYAAMPNENHGHRKPHFLSSFIGNNKAAIFELPPITQKVVDFVKKNKVDLIWSVVQGQTTIKLTNRVAKITEIPYVVQVWDPPNWWLRDNRFDKITMKWVLNEFGRIIRNSSCCIAASWAMAEEYTKRYKCKKSIPVILGLEPSRVLPKGCKKDDQFVIAFAGQTYASAELNAFISSLDLLGWQLGGKKIILRLYGATVQTYFKEGTRIEIRGWVPYEEMIPELAATDLLYCPYWFSSEFEEEARMSFPSKLTTYFKTGVPVLFHGPEYASPRRFIEQNEAAYIAGTLDPRDIAETLRFALNDPNRFLIGKRGFDAFTRFLSLENMRASFFEALGIKDREVAGK